MTRSLLEDAVALRLIADVPVGVFLSGGIDSSAVVALARRCSTGGVRTISVVFPEEEYSEAPFSRLMAQRFQTEHTEVILSSDALRQKLPQAIRAMDQPSVDGINTYVVSQAARQSGLKVVLSGLGGDELFGGYGSFMWVPRLERQRQMTPELLGSALGWGIKTLMGDSDRGRKLHRWFCGKVPSGQAYMLFRELFSPEDRRRLVPVLGDRGDVWSDLPGNAHMIVDGMSRVSVCELAGYMQNVLLRDTDAMSMAHSLEVRVPLIDHKLVEFVLRLPGRAKYNGRVPKWLLVKALGHDLPVEVVNRRKQGFTLPFAIWMAGRLKVEIEQVLLDPEIGGALSNLLDGHAVEEIWSRFLGGQGVWVRPWALYTLKQWVHTHLG